MRYDVFTDFHINRFCNFDCSYCYLHGADKRNRVRRGADKDRIIEGFNRTGLTWFIHITGGEPFLHPEFPALCAGLVQRHYISVNTNLSTANVREFAQSVPPERVGYVHCSYHVESRRGEETRARFVEKFRILKEKGFAVHASQVVTPTVVREFPDLFEELAKDGVILRPKVLKGLYRYRSHPSAYTAAERDLICRYIARCNEEEGEPDFFTTFFFREDEFVEGDLSFKGERCAAGAKFVVIRENGDATRCLDVSESLGNVFDGTLRLCAESACCPATKCSSPRFGLNFCEGVPVCVRHHPARGIVGQLIRNARRWIKRRQVETLAPPRGTPSA